MVKSPKPADTLAELKSMLELLVSRSDDHEAEDQGMCPTCGQMPAPHMGTPKGGVMVVKGKLPANVDLGAALQEFLSGVLTRKK